MMTWDELIPQKPKSRLSAVLSGARLPLAAGRFLLTAPGIRYLAALPLLFTALFYAPVSYTHLTLPTIYSV